MSGEKPPETNIELLLTHLQPGSLAARLVTGYGGADNNKRDAALKSVVAARLREIVSGHGDADSKQD
jgi:hypothetical protein